MYCTNCGAEIPDGTGICPKCGVSTSSQKPVSSTAATNRAPKSIGGFVCGLLGFLLDLVPVVGLVLSIVGVALCGSGKRQVASSHQNYEGEGLLSAGQILGIIGIIVSSLTLIATIIWGIALGGGLFFLWDNVMDILNW